MARTATGGERFARILNSRFTNRALLGAALIVLSTACGMGGGSAGGSTAPGITYNGPTNWDITGPQGGPFTNTSLIVVLDNSGSTAVSWSATSVPSYVLLDQMNGVIQPNTTARIHADLNAAVAQALAPGLYRETLTFHDDSDPVPDIDIACTLLVQTQGTSSDLQPATNFASQGAAGGPFVPDGTTYTLTNTGSTQLGWQAGAADAWVSVAPTSGQLAPGGSVDVSVSINDPATVGLALGLHQSLVSFVDASNAAVLHTRDVNLNVLQGSSTTGWTVFTPSADTRMVYVSSSTGNDSNNGLSDTTPKRTIAGGRSLIRNGFPDWLLLKKGDVWDERFDNWNASGRSLTEPLLISSYGTASARPLIRTGTQTGFDAFQGTHADNLAIVGLHFWANTFNGSQGAPRGMQIFGSVTNLLIEDCYLQAYDTNIVMQGSPEGQGRHHNIAVRRNVIVDAYTTQGGNTAGIFASSIDNGLFEENVIDHNGWREDVPGSTPSWFLHNVYLQNGCTGIVFRGNIVSGTDGVQQRPGGICENNLFMKNAISFQLGSGTSPEPAGVTGTVRNNVFLDGRDLQAGNPRGWGIITGNVLNARYEYNIVAHNVTGTAPNPFILNFDNGHGNPQGMQNCTFDHNITYDWGSTGRGAQVASYQSSTITNLTLSNNDIQDTVDSTFVASLSSPDANLLSQIHCSNNHWFRAGGNVNQVFQANGTSMSFDAFRAAVGDTTSTFGAVSYPDPNRTIATYHASIGGAPSYDAFMAEARNQSKSNWRVQYTADAVNTYIRAGFGL